MTIFEYLSKYAVLAPYGTLFGVAVALCQFRKNNKQQVTNFEDSLTKEYREIVRRIPYKALIGVELCQKEQADAYNEIYNYMDLCNEQIFLRKSGRVRRATWLNWQEGMKVNFDLAAFRDASAEIYSELKDNFKELNRVQSAGYDTDPKKWGGRIFCCAALSL
jgi:hypothetical protein